MSDIEKQLTVEEMKALLDSIQVKYRSNATKSTLKHLISKHKAQLPEEDKVSQNSTGGDLDILDQKVTVEENIILPEGSNEPDINGESDTSESGLDEAFVKSGDEIISVSGFSDKHIELLEQENNSEESLESEGLVQQGDNTFSETNQPEHAVIRTLETPINDSGVNLLYPQLIMTMNPEPNNSVFEKLLQEDDSPERLVIKRNVLKKFVEELFTAGRNGYTLSNERYSVSIMDMPWRTVLVKGDTDNVQPLVDPAIKIKVKTYKSKDFINELLHFARYGARIGAIKNITIDSGHYVFEVLVDKEYVLRKNKDYYSGRV